MGKAKKGGDKNKRATPVCECDHPFKCSCGHRPERPSKGHKWDPETKSWGGKGHKQKGASGQTALISQQAKTTTVGQTTLEQWQRLPSQLLEDYCRKQKKGVAPKYKNVEKKPKTFKYRVIIPDGKDPDKDQFFVPAAGVSNEEQAKEEACLLALLHLTPTIPHERKLPDPYKQTWLNAVEARKQEKKSKGKNGSSVQNQQHSDAKQGKARGAQASNNLTMASSYTSQSERRKAQQDKQRIRKARIRHHENIRLANQNHQVFMSASIRRQLERLLRGDTNFFENGNDDDEVIEDATSDAQGYVEGRLHREGFTRRQARAAYSELGRESVNEDQWEKAYEECLQWLLVHLNEDQLPGGFDPRGGTLDVIRPVSSNIGATSPETTDFANSYGISAEEAVLLRQFAKKKGKSLEKVFFDTAYEVSGALRVEDQADPSPDPSIIQDEIEALDAIFGSECVVSHVNGITTISAPLEGDFTLQMCVAKDKYPLLPPISAVIKGNWTRNVGGSCHIELVKFISDLTLGEPMFFSLHGFANEIVSEIDEKAIVSLLPSLERQVTPDASSKPVQKSIPVKEKSKPRRQVHRRPRERHPFWCKKPSETPVAKSEPNISPSLASIRRSLPAAGARDKLLSSLREADEGGRVLLVTGDTGSGKTTQIPQFILETHPAEAKIVVCQPRRLAATGVAARVAEERGESQPGIGSVGYVVRGDTALSKDSRLVFCTTGVLLRQLQSEAALDCLTHIVVDEVHERQLDTDVLLGLLKQNLKTYKHIRVVLMSATLDADRFAAYWGSSTPRLHIPGRTFPVTDFLLEDVLSLTGYIPRKKKKQPGASKGPEETSDAEEDGPIGSHGIPISDLVKRVDETSIDYDLLGTLIRHLIMTKAAASDGSILVFLPGAPEINRAMETVKRCASDQNLFVLPLHGGLQPKEQIAVFKPAPPGLTKVVLSTNVAETSVTIPDCTIVVDCAREKQSSFDPTNRMPLLVEQFCSKASLKQRRGRAGRVRKGDCYKMISKSTFNKLKEHGEPEIRRCALDQTLLSLLFLGVERSSKGVFMKTLLDPPSQKSLDAAICSLLQVGAIEQLDEGDDLLLTPLGMQLAGIPAPPTVGKIMILGSILGCRSATLAMAAGMSLGRSPFLRIDTPRRRKGEEVDEKTAIQDMKTENVLNRRREMFKTVGSSDHAFLAYVFMEWKANGTGGGKRRAFCEDLGLSFNGMRDMLQLVNQLESSLSAVGYHGSKDSDSNAYSWRIIRSCIVAALSPGQLVKIVRPAITYHETAEGAREKDGEARQLKFFVRSTDDGTISASKNNEERVFIHPSSSNFSTGTYSCPWLVYHSLVRTSKAFLRDVTECSAYALLLFGGKLDVKASEGVILVDGFVTLSANARIGSLMAGLRGKVDDLLRKKVRDPTFEIAGCDEMGLIVKLLVTDGLGT